MQKKSGPLDIFSKYTETGDRSAHDKQTNRKLEKPLPNINSKRPLHNDKTDGGNVQFPEHDLNGVDENEDVCNDNGVTVVDMNGLKDEMDSAGFEIEQAKAEYV